MMRDVTLQINLSPGDTESASEMVPHIVRAHRSEFAERLLVVDCNRPQQTPIVDISKRFPLKRFKESVVRIREIAESFKQQGIIDRIIYLEPEDEIYEHISRKYLRGITQATHDYGGCALMAYLVAFETVQTPYILHYDADMLIYQRQGYDWIREAKRILDNQSEYAAVTPRLAPPLQESNTEQPTLYQWPVSIQTEHGWRDQWFSTRVFLFRRKTLLDSLPLLRGKRYLRAIFRKLLSRGFPVSPEVMISSRMKQMNKYHLQLASEEAWVVHPCDKSERYLSRLKSIIEIIESGHIPDGQRGLPDLNLELCWSNVTEGSGA